MAGQLSKLTPEVRERLVLAVKAGNYREAAAAYAGVGYSTFMRWNADGRKAKAAGKETIFSQLLDEIEHAEREAEAQMVLLWRTHMKTDYRAIRDFLERRYPTRWCKREVIAHETPPPAPDGRAVADPFCKQLAENPDALQKYGELLAALAGG